MLGTERTQITEVCACVRACDTEREICVSVWYEMGKTEKSQDQLLLLVYYLLLIFIPLLLAVRKWIVMCFGIICSMFLVLVIYWSFHTCEFILFIKFRKFPVIISSDILSSLPIPYLLLWTQQFQVYLSIWNRPTVHLHLVLTFFSLLFLFVILNGVYCCLHLC